MKFTSFAVFRFYHGRRCHIGSTGPVAHWERRCDVCRFSTWESYGIAVALQWLEARILPGPLNFSFAPCLDLRLAQGKDAWNAIHGESIFCALPGFQPKRIYGDVLHLLDLALTVDVCTSFMLEYTSSGPRGPQLAQLLSDYREWAGRMQLPTALKANPRCFTVKILVPKTGEYPSLSQKFLKGAAARMLSFFLCEIAIAHARSQDDAHSRCLECIIRLRVRGFKQTCMWPTLNVWQLRHMANVLLGLCNYYTVLAENTPEPYTFNGCFPVSPVPMHSFHFDAIFSCKCASQEILENISSSEPSRASRQRAEACLHCLPHKLQLLLICDYAYR